MNFETIKYDIEPDELRATITLNRPEKMNAISGTVVDELCEALDDAESDDDVRAVALTGAGEDAFSSGYDLTAEGRPGEYEGETTSADDYIERMAATTRHIHRIWNFPKPVIAGVNGYCLAGGSDLAMICDVVIASETASLGYPGQRIAGHPPTLTYPFFMGLHEAKELLYTGKIVGAERAREMGVFNRVVPDDELMDAVYADIDDIKKVPGNGVRIQKESINAVAEQQGISGTLRLSELLDSLAHMTELSQEYNRVAQEADGLDERLEWMNELDKRMRDTRE